MEVSEAEEILMQLLKSCGVTMDGGIVILSLLETEEMIEQMLDWFREQIDPPATQPTENQILVAAVKIAGLME